jgi:hypothetical protein
MLVGLALRFDRKTGDFNRTSGYVANQNEGETGLRQDLLFAVRLAERFQTGLALSFLQTWRQFESESDFGAGLGDFGLSFRYDFLEPGEHAVIPAIALVSGLSVSAGKTIEHSTSPLAADATSSGYSQVTTALAIADLFFDRVYVEAAAALTYWIPRSVDEVSVARGLEFSGSLGASWALAGSANIGVLGTFQLQGETRTEGVAAVGSGRRATTFSIVAAVPVSTFRVQLSLFDTLQISGLGKNEPAIFGARVAVIWLL